MNRIFDVVYKTALVATPLTLGYFIFSATYMYDGHRKLKLQEYLSSEGLPEEEIDIIVNRDLPGRKMYVKDNLYLFAKNENKENERKFMKQEKNQ